MRRALRFIAGSAIALVALAGPAVSAASAASATRADHVAPAIFIPKAVSVTTCILHGGQPNYFFNVCEGGLFDGWPLDPGPVVVHDPALSLNL